MNQQCTIRRLEQQVRQKDRLLMEMQKNLHEKDSHNATLIASNLSLTSTLELLRHQIAHLTKANLALQSEIGKASPQNAAKDL